MRSSVVVTGLFMSGLGLLLYILELPFVFSWSLPFMIGGLALSAAGAAVREAPKHIDPPDGYKFCVYCNEPMESLAKRCDRCNGIQPLLS